MSQRIDYYNNAVAALQTQLNNIIRKINAMRISPLLKKRLIAAAINAANANLEILKKQFKTKKSALLIGINYTNTPYELYGCINDTKNIQNLLQTKYGFTDIKMLNDETTEKPTRQNILNGLQTLLNNAEPGDTVFFMYSGHGTCTYDFSGDETDGQDEMIVPLDTQCILDDELKKIIQTSLKPGTKLLALFDSCFSGTVMDLKYTYQQADNTKEPETMGDVYMISGCTDKQTSADTVAIINGKEMASGAMTCAFLAMIQQSPNMQTLVTNMQTFLSTNGYPQKPLLSSGKKVNYSTTAFL
jgi:hypothetical protein